MNATQTAVAKYRAALPQLTNTPFLTDGGIETTLIFHDGLELPHFAAYDLLTRDGGTEALRRYFEPYVQTARASGVGIVLETATWRASPDWASRLGHSTAELAELNRRAVRLLEGLRADYETETTPIVISGCVGPRGDGYVVGAAMTADEAEAYHSEQIGTFAGTAADLVTAITMTYVDEAVGIVRAGQRRGAPRRDLVHRRDGRPATERAVAPRGDRGGGLPDRRRGRVLHGQLRHPSHFEGVLEAGEGWTARIRGLRANASRLSHAELDEAEELDEGDPEELAADVCGAPLAAAAALCARWLLRHRPSPHRGDEPSVARGLRLIREPQRGVRA